MTDYELIAKMLLMASDHTPDGYPAVTMGEISRLVGLAIRGVDYNGHIDHVTATPDYEGYVSSYGWVMLGDGYFRKLTAFAERYEALKITVKTFLHDLDAHEERVKPSMIRMNSAMWMQVQAFRNLLEDK